MKTREQLELLLLMQKHRIGELQELKQKVEQAICVDVNLWLYFRAKIARAKGKLNHYKQVLAITPQDGVADTELLQKGVTVKIVRASRKSLWVRPMDKYIGLLGTIEAITTSGNYKVKTELDLNPDMLYYFPPESLKFIE